jgi:hypothetical protein
MPPAILRFALQNMGRFADQIHAGFTLYIPPTTSRPIQDSICSQSCTAWPTCAASRDRDPNQRLTLGSEQSWLKWRSGKRKRSFA